MTTIPNGSQLLIYPMKECTIAAGFKDAKYPTDPNHRFTHYGVDFDSMAAVDFEVISSGKGTVIGVEQNQNSLGHVVVIRYPSVYIPTTGQVKDLIFRYMHLMTCSVQKGSTVSAYSKLGTVSGNHPWWNHIHLEVDTDTEHPFYTPQVSEAASAMLIRAGADDRTMLDPIGVLVAGKKQTAVLHPLAVYVSAKDRPRYKEGDFMATDSTGQKLILPTNNATITAGYKNEKYRSKFGFSHFGLDLTGQTTVYASGNGTVLACGLDNVLGNVIVVKYPNTYNHKTEKTADILMRYNHLASIRVSKGQSVDKDTVLGIMGNTGQYSTGVHLHIEADTDAREQYACWTPTLSGNSNLMKAGEDSTVNPAEVLHVKTSAPDCQSVRRLNDGYSADADVNIPTIQ